MDETGAYYTDEVSQKEKHQYIISSVQLLSHVQLCNPMNRSMPGLPVHHQLPEFTQTHVRGVGDAIQPSHPLLSLSPPGPNPSQHQIFSNESILRMRWPKYWSFSYSISPSSEYSGWNIQSILKEGLVGSACSPSDSQESSSTPQFKSINSLALSFLYSPTVTTMTTGKTIALSRWTFVGKVMFLLFNTLSRFVIDFLPGSKSLLISWLQSPSAVILVPPQK